MTFEELVKEEQSIRAKLVQLRAEMDAVSILEKNSVVSRIYERCKNTRYIVDKGNPDWYIYKKIENIRVYDNEVGCHVLEEIRINAIIDGTDFGRVRSENFEIGGRISQVTFGQNSGYISDDVYPVSEEEYNEARLFVIAQVEIGQQFLAKYPDRNKKEESEINEDDDIQAVHDFRPSRRTYR